MWSTLGGEPSGRLWGPPLIGGRGGRALLVLAAVRDGTSGTRTHIAHLDLTHGGRARASALTIGPQEVVSIVAWDEDNNYM